MLNFFLSYSELDPQNYLFKYNFVVSAAVVMRMFVFTWADVLLHDQSDPLVDSFVVVCYPGWGRHPRRIPQCSALTSPHPTLHLNPSWTAEIQSLNTLHSTSNSPTCRLYLLRWITTWFMFITTEKYPSHWNSKGLSVNTFYSTSTTYYE